MTVTLKKKPSLYRKSIHEFFDKNFLLGDSAYPCLDWLTYPFKDNDNLTQNEKIFNYLHSVIENVFGLLKARFRRLKFFYNNDLTFVVKFIIVAAVLHNICIDNQGEFDIDENEDNENIIDTVEELVV